MKRMYKLAEEDDHKVR